MPEPLVENVIVIGAGVGGLILLAWGILCFVYSHLPSFPEDDGESM